MSKLSKGSKRIGHGPGYTVDKVRYPRGASTLRVNFDKYGPMSTNSKGYASTTGRKVTKR